ncbi:hypothetical protein NIES37_19140 [Tolypothrix tenuis PCC 7101]|uniref:Type II secretion system protein GspC N-terminal domain-containing protein n=1 Tax=Tolypothrix tenuis PCC 7101 TaxID=231146 RepID=A0A1Z4MWV5_9CYAN|nr:hypothetical protein [Aulosira sp. FACHB-113]BAY97966.1 hypothetical protein NIES37_19140 [Tolypothrix tenuis PCC 7101]BAZ71527.1 hypothetical protein NIES50_00700 [Aulosira laxa NIES-50]
MLKEASTRFIIPEASDELISNEPWTIEVYADGLMDELFADIDNVLDYSGSFPTQTVNVQYVPVQTVRMPEIVLPDDPHQNIQGVSQIRDNPVRKTVIENAPRKAVTRKIKKSRKPLATLLIVGTTIVGVAIAGILFLLNSKAFTFPVVPNLATNLQIAPRAVPQKVDVQAELVDYMLGALSVIDQQENRNNQSYATPGIANPKPAALAVANDARNVLLPQPLTANNTPPAPVRSTNVVERIYIPVYQAPSPMRYTPPLLPGVPKTISSVGSASRLNPVKKALNSPRKPAKPVSVNMYAAAVRPDLKAVGVRTAPLVVKQSSNLLPTLPVASFRVAPPQLPTATAPASAASQHQVVATVPEVYAPTQTLEGILELGNKSAALFKIDGVSHRVVVGESIGSSGWTLVDVNNGEAIVRRNGEVRSIYTGQSL